MISIHGDKEFNEIRRVARQWPRRTRALRKIVAYESARKTHAFLLERIPSDNAWRDYRESLQVVQVSAGRGESAYALRANPNFRGATEVTKEEAILYVRARRGVKRPNPGVLVLERFNPWTVDTLPITPKDTDATIFSRKVDKAVSDKIRKRRLRDRHMWRSELSRAGVRVKERPSKKNLPKVVPDIAHAAFNLEFGQGTKPVPHWRPALRQLKRSSMKRMKRNPKIVRLFTDPAFTGWKRWEKIRTSAKIRQGEARKFVPFQRKLGIRT